MWRDRARFACLNDPPAGVSQLQVIIERNWKQALVRSASLRRRLQHPRAVDRGLFVQRQLAKPTVGCLAERFRFRARLASCRQSFLPRLDTIVGGSVSRCFGRLGFTSSNLIEIHVDATDQYRRRVDHSCGFR